MRGSHVGAAAAPPHAAAPLVLGAAPHLGPAPRARPWPAARRPHRRPPAARVKRCRRALHNKAPHLQHQQRARPMRAAAAEATVPATRGAVCSVRPCTRRPSTQQCSQVRHTPALKGSTAPRWAAASGTHCVGRARPPAAPPPGGAGPARVRTPTALQGWPTVLQLWQRSSCVGQAHTMRRRKPTTYATRTLPLAPVPPFQCAESRPCGSCAFTSIQHAPPHATTSTSTERVGSAESVVVVTPAQLLLPLSCIVAAGAAPAAASEGSRTAGWPGGACTAAACCGRPCTAPVACCCPRACCRSRLRACLARDAPQRGSAPQAAVWKRRLSATTPGASCRRGGGHVTACGEELEHAVCVRARAVCAPACVLMHMLHPPHTHLRCLQLAPQPPQIVGHALELCWCDLRHAAASGAGPRTRGSGRGRVHGPIRPHGA